MGGIEGAVGTGGICIVRWYTIGDESPVPVFDITSAEPSKTRSVHTFAFPRRVATRTLAVYVPRGLPIAGKKTFSAWNPKNV
jgi:hypothetical protein